MATTFHVPYTSHILVLKVVHTPSYTLEAPAAAVAAILTTMSKNGIVQSIHEMVWTHYQLMSQKNT